MLEQPPLIALTPNVMAPAPRRFYPGKALQYGEDAMGRAVAAAGGLPALVPHPDLGDPAGAATPGPSEAPLPGLEAYCAAVAARFDGLLLTGGEDIAPEWYGEDPGHPDWAGNPARDRFEMALYRAFIHHHKPVLGVCRGAQLIAVAEGGRLCQDIPSRGPTDALDHRCQARYDTLAHDVHLDAQSWLAGIWGDEPHVINSVHHQAIIAIPDTLTPIATAPDGTLEAFVRAGAGPFVSGVQWHPEWMQDRPSQRRLFERFIEACR